MIDKEKRARVQWNKLFEPTLHSETELKPTEDNEDFNGGDCWEEEDE